MNEGFCSKPLSSFFFKDRVSLCTSGCLDLREGLSLPPESWVKGVHHHTQLSKAPLFCFCFKCPLDPKDGRPRDRP